MCISNFKQINLLYKSALALVIVAIPLFAAECYLRKVSRNLHSTYILKYEELYNSSKPADIIIIGSSHSAHGINPTEINLPDKRIYNFSFNFAGPRFQSGLVNLVKKHNKKPELVIFSVDWFMFDDRYLTRSIASDLRFMPLHDQTGLPGIISLPKKLLGRLYVTHESSLLRSLLDNYTGRQQEIDARVLLGDYSAGFTPYDGPFVSYNNISGKISTDASLMHEFIQLTRSLINDGIQLVFIQPPEYLPESDLNNMSINNRIIAKIAQEHGIPFLNYNDERKSGLNNDSRYFTDISHLNLLGATTYSRVLSGDIKQLIATGRIRLKPAQSL